MRKKICTVMCICLLIGLVSGCESKESDLPNSVTVSESLEAKNDFAEGDSAADSEADHNMKTADSVENESFEDAVNTSGLPLRDGAALVVIVTRCSYSGGSDKVWSRFAEEYEFDSEGRKLRHISYGLYSDALREYEYDADGNLIRKICYDLKKDDSEMREWTEYQYVREDSGELHTQIESEYNAEGKLLRESQYDSDSRLIKQTVYREGGNGYEYGIYRVDEYDSLRNLLRITYYDGQGNVTNWSEEVFDDAGNRTLYAYYDAEGNIDIYEGYDCDTYMYIYQYWPSENEYDETGNLIRSTDYDYEGNVTEIAEYSYDDANRLVKEWYYFSDHDYTTEHVYEYDNAGNEVKEFLDQQIRREREYDDRNRLIKYTEYSFGELECWYEYEYRMIGVAEENYPFDRISLTKYLYN